MESQRAVGGHTEEGEELPGAWRTKTGDTGGTCHKSMFKLQICLVRS